MPIINMVYKKKKGWQPWANTIAYYPLSSNLIDASWNSSDIIPSDSSSVIGNYQGIDCFNLNWYYCTVSNIDTLATSNEYTFNFWLYRTARFDIMYAENGSRWAWWLMMYSGESQARWGNKTNQSTAFFEPPYNTWLNIVFTVLNWEWSIYVNNNKTVLKSSWVLAPNHNGTPLIIGGDYAYNNQGNWYLSKLIIEDRWWTAQEVADYYNQTKATYWL